MCGGAGALLLCSSTVLGDPPSQQHFWWWRHINKCSVWSFPEPVFVHPDNHFSGKAIWRCLYILPKYQVSSLIACPQSLPAEHPLCAVRAQLSHKGNSFFFSICTWESRLPVQLAVNSSTQSANLLHLQQPGLSSIQKDPPLPTFYEAIVGQKRSHGPSLRQWPWHLHYQVTTANQL